MADCTGQLQAAVALEFLREDKPAGVHLNFGFRRTQMAVYWTKPLQNQRWCPLLLLPLRKAALIAQPLALCCIAALLTIQTEFTVQCHVQKHAMQSLLNQSRHRQTACLELGWRWEADDQENQYKAGDSSGTHTTVGPIAGFVMDVTEDENGHAEGQCHAINATYSDLVPHY
jgi:hypothetical protein